MALFLQSRWKSERSRLRATISPPHPAPPPFLYAEWTVLHNIAPIIHQAAEKTIHIHQFSPRELWSRWYKRLYGSDHISHSGLINGWTQSQMLLAGLHMFQLPLRGQKEIIIASNTLKNMCICTFHPPLTASARFLIKRSIILINNESILNCKYFIVYFNNITMTWEFSYSSIFLCKETCVIMSCEFKYKKGK